MNDYDGIIFSINSYACQQLCSIGTEGVRGMLLVGRKPLLYYSISALLGVGLERIHVVCSTKERVSYEAYVKEENWRNRRDKLSAFCSPHMVTEPQFFFTTYDELEQLSPIQLLEKVRPVLQSNIFFIVEIGLLIADGLAGLADTFHSNDAAVAMLFTPMPSEFRDKKYDPRTRCTYSLYVTESHKNDVSSNICTPPKTQRLRYVTPTPVAQMKKLGMPLVADGDVKKRSTNKRQKSSDFILFQEDDNSHTMLLYNFMVDCNTCIMHSYLLDYLLANQKEYEAKEGFLQPLINKYQYQQRSTLTMADTLDSNGLYDLDKLCNSMFDMFPRPTLLNDRVHVHICDKSSLCLPLNCLEYYHLANHKVVSKPNIYLKDQDPRIDPTSQLKIRLPETVTVGANSSIQNDCTVKCSVIGPNVDIGEKVKILNSVILEGSRIESGAKIVDSVIGANVVVAKDSQIEACFVHREFKVSANKSYKDSKIGVQ